MSTIRFHTNSTTGWTGDYYHILHHRLRRLMEDEMAYTDARLTRKKLSDALYTNQMYLAAAIRQFYNCTYTEYLTHLRLHYACQLLADTERNSTIESIALDAGFGSRFTLIRQFKARFGIPPEVYRRQMQQRAAARFTDKEEIITIK